MGNVLKQNLLELNLKSYFSQPRGKKDVPDQQVAKHRFNFNHVCDHPANSMSNIYSAILALSQEISGDLVNNRWVLWALYTVEEGGSAVLRVSNGTDLQS